MAIFKIKGEYLYGLLKKSGIKEVADSIYVSSLVKDRVGTLRKKGFVCEDYKEYDPEGNALIICKLSCSLDEQEDPTLPNKYPGYYYWVWYNGEFFEVIGETEKYVYVKVNGIAHADALGIPREKVLAKYPEDAEVERWWLKKREIKMPDELGKGKYIYLYVGEFFILRVFEIVRRDGNIIRVRGKKCPAGPAKYEYEWIIRTIKEGTYPWSTSYDMIKEIAENAEPEVWIEGDCVYYEATFDLEVFRKYKGKRDEYGSVVLDYYLYGEEEVPYRL